MTIQRRSRASMPTTPLSEARDKIRDALCKLFECPEKLGPYVIVEDAVTNRFVQFAGCAELGGFLDVPAFGIRAQIYPEPINAIRDVDLATDQAIHYLKAQQLPDCAELRIIFETSQREQPS